MFRVSSVNTKPAAHHITKSSGRCWFFSSGMIHFWSTTLTANDVDLADQEKKQISFVTSFLSSSSASSAVNLCRLLGYPFSNETYSAIINAYEKSLSGDRTVRFGDAEGLRYSRDLLRARRQSRRNSRRLSAWWTGRRIDTDVSSVLRSGG